MELIILKISLILLVIIYMDTRYIIKDTTAFCYLCKYRDFGNELITEIHTVNERVDNSTIVLFYHDNMYLKSIEYIGTVKWRARE